MKKVGSLFIVFLFAMRVLYPVFSYAQEMPTPTITITPTVSPTDEPTPSVTPCPTIDVSASNSATLTTAVTNSSNTGENTITGTPSATPSPEEEATPSPSPTPISTNSITTGNAITTTNEENTVNTNLNNAQVEFQTINIFLNTDGSIDLSAPLAVAADIASQSATSSANILMTSSTNYATLTNDITAVSNTGDNSANSSGNLIINTGNAYSLVQLLNKVNLTLVGSTIHIVTVNIYGTLNGNIILPDEASQPGSIVTSLTATNSATVTNTVTNTTNTGSNTAITTGSAHITTGNATSIVNVTNIINTIMLNATFEHLYINTFGEWQGNFLGWDGLGPQQGGGSMDVAQMPDSSGNSNILAGNSSISNTAHVTNTISNTANTGGNTTSGGNSSITTGNAYGYVNLMNFINSLFINSHGFLGFINIFGTFNGNIGGQSAFVTPTPIESGPTPTVSPTPQQTADTTVHNEDGGQLSVSTYNNVGAYVLPGDTVTFFATVKNTGSGMVYGATLHIDLIQNGEDLGGATFQLGNIPAGHGIKLSTGLVLSKDAPLGAYTAHASADGTTGDSAIPVHAVADSYFTVAGPVLGATTMNNPIDSTPTPTNEPQKAVLSDSTTKTTNTNMSLFSALIFILLAYVGVRILRAKEQLCIAFATNKTLRERIHALKLFLL